MRLVVAAAVLVVSSLAVAGDVPTFAPAPPTPDQVATAFLSGEDGGRAAAEKAIAGGDAQFLRSVLASVRKMLHSAPPEDGSESVVFGSSDVPPDAASAKRGVAFEVRFVEL